MEKVADDNGGPKLTSQRWIMGYIGFFVQVINSCIRVNMNLAIVCMVKTATTDQVADISNGSISVILNQTEWETEDVVPGCAEVNTDAVYETAEFEWDKTVQSWILSAYFYGYIATQIPGGLLAKKYGGKIMVTFGILIPSFGCLLTPSLTRISVILTIVIRVCTGLCSAVTLPGWFAMVGEWSPVYERSRMTAIAMAGQAAGAILAYSTSGILCMHGFDNGWGSIFYIHGVIGLFITALWQYLTAGSPAEHPRITEKERRYLHKQLNTKQDKSEDKRTCTPWRKMLTSASVWSMFICHICSNVTYYTILTCLPLFMKEVLKFDVQSNGLYSSLPFLSSITGMFLAAFLADYIMSLHLLTPTATRRCIQIIAFLGSSAFLVSSGFVTCDRRELVICFVCLSTFFHSFGDSAGYSCLAVDMAPKFGSLIFAVSNTIATIPGTLAPLVVAKIAANGTSEEWQTIFYIASGFAVTGCLVFGSLSSSELQPWAEGPDVNMELTVVLKTDHADVVSHTRTDTDGSSTEERDSFIVPGSNL